MELGKEEKKEDEVYYIKMTEIRSTGADGVAKIIKEHAKVILLSAEGAIELSMAEFK